MLLQLKIDEAMRNNGEQASKIATFVTSWLTTKAWVLNGQQLFKGHAWCLTEYLKLAVYSRYGKHC